MKHVTMRDVAKRAGVSVNTVSRALSGKPDVSPETRAKVLAVAQELGYHPNKLARGLRSDKTFTIGVIVTDIANPFFGALVKGVEQAARNYEYSIILQDTDEDLEREREAIRVLLAERVDGILITPIQRSADTIRELESSGVPVVLLGRKFDDLAVDYVVTDDVRGGFLATKHLLELGHREIALINGPGYISSAQDRLAGYRQALVESGVGYREDLVWEGAVTMEDGYRLARQALAKRPRPTAVFAYSDFVAFGVIQAIQEVGLVVPDDIAVVGYDGIDFSAHAAVPLTTVRIPKRELGRKATEILLNKLTAHHSPGVQAVKLPVELVIRSSTDKRR